MAHHLGLRGPLGVGRRGRQERAHQGEGLEVHARGAEPRAVHGVHQAVDHLALGGHHDHALLVGRVALEGGHGLEVEDRLVEGDRHDLAGLELDRGTELPGVVHAGHLQGAHRDLGVGDPQAHAPAGEALLTPHALDLGRDGVGVDQLAVVHETLGQGPHRGAANRVAAAAAPELRRLQRARSDVEGHRVAGCSE